MVTQLERNGEQIISISEGLALVASKSEPGTWHAVRDAERCDCLGYTYRGHCRHISAVAPAILMCQDCGATEGVVNRQYYVGGTHKWFSECEDSEACENRRNDVEIDRLGDAYVGG
jgi:hypothetical protein